MKKLLKKGLLAGIGLGLLARDKIEDTARKLAKEAKLSEKETRQFIDDVKEHAGQTISEIEQKIDQRVQEAVAKMGFASRSDYEELQNKIEQIHALLLKRDDEQSGSAAKAEAQLMSDGKPASEAPQDAGQSEAEPKKKTSRPKKTVAGEQSTQNP